MQHVPTTHFICISAELVGVLARLQSITCGSGSSVCGQWSPSGAAAQVLKASLSKEGLAAEQWLCWLQDQWQISGVFL